MARHAAHHRIIHKIEVNRPVTASIALGHVIAMRPDSHEVVGAFPAKGFVGGDRIVPIPVEGRHVVVEAVAVVEVLVDAEQPVMGEAVAFDNLLAPSTHLKEDLIVAPQRFAMPVVIPAEQHNGREQMAAAQLASWER